MSDFSFYGLLISRTPICAGAPGSSKLYVLAEAERWRSAGWGADSPPVAYTHHAVSFSPTPIDRELFISST
ncbi:hypothetical protein EVAR_27367_1 [Eumeta japonica]|uniref:Uncharacterized protein n=1 Tax=Eumeta variegata TaxID=151549 RepID=A0A4C1X4P2_EUMVA|nr:hypothetical protein EVAR_27367_1 [Eumeta japonica]